MATARASASVSRPWRTWPTSHTTGSFDILIEAHLPDNEGLYRFLNEDLHEIEGIAHTDTWHILRTDTTNFEWAGEDAGRDPADEVADHG